MQVPMLMAEVGMELHEVVALERGFDCYVVSSDCFRVGV